MCVHLCVAEPVVPAGAQAAVAPGSRQHPLQTLSLGQHVLLPTSPPPQAQEGISRCRASAIVSRWPSDVPDGGEPWVLPVGSGGSDFGRDGAIAIMSPFLFSQGLFQGEPPFLLCSEPISGSASGRHQRATPAFPPVLLCLVWLHG